MLHLAEREGANVRPTNLLDRGAWDRPKQEVKPHVLAALHPLEAADKSNRLAFATLDRQPAIAADGTRRGESCVAGDLWQRAGRNVGRFRHRAPAPEHRQVLDWLAVDFMEHGWSHKHLIRTIVTSATYQQSSRPTPEMLARDPRIVTWPAARASAWKRRWCATMR